MSSKPSQCLHAPHCAYHAECYLPRAGQARALELLQTPEAPAVLWGPSLSGKTWLMKHLLRQMRKRPDLHNACVDLDLRKYDSERFDSPDAFSKAFAQDLLEALQEPEDCLEPIWAQAEDPFQALDWLLAHLLQNVESELILALDNASAIRGRAFAQQFYWLLRACCEAAGEEPWSRLRLLLTVEADPASLAASEEMSPFALTEPIRLEDLDEGQTRTLAELHGLDCGEAELQALRQLVGGHPYLLRLALHQAAGMGRPLDELLEQIRASETGGVYLHHLMQQRNLLRQNPELFEALERLRSEPAAKLEESAALALEAAGLILRAADGCRLRYPLYEKLTA